MRFEYYLTENRNEIFNVIKDLKNIEWRSVKDKFIKHIKNFTNIFTDENEKEALKIINKHFKLNLKSLDQILKVEIKEGYTINEDLKHWWDFVRGTGFSVVSFVPALNAWIEFDKMLRAGSISGGNIRVMIIYTLIWLTFLSIKYTADWRKWKKENPDEYAKERSMGKGGLL